MARVLPYRCPCCATQTMRAADPGDLMVCESRCVSCGGPCLGVPVVMDAPLRLLTPPALLVRPVALPTGTFAG